MSTQMESRLAEALEARAALVQPGPLGDWSRTAPTSTRWRRPVVVALIAAACLAVVVIPLTLSGKGDDSPTVHVPLPKQTFVLPQGRFSAPEPQLVDRLTGDVDGDGRPDLVSTQRGAFTVRLAGDPGHPITLKTGQAHGLVGFTPTPGTGLAIVAADASLADGDQWLVLALRNGRLVILQPGETATPQGKPGTLTATPGVVRGYQTSWLTSQGALMSGVLDPMQHGQRNLAVDVTRTDVGRQHLVETRLGRWCWDVVTQAVPAPCATGTQAAYDPGPHGGLPRLVPHVDINDSIGITGETWTEPFLSLHLEHGAKHATQEFDQTYDLVGTIEGHSVRAQAGVFVPVVLKTIVDLGHGVRGLAVENADHGPGWNFLSYVQERLQTTRVNSNLRPGFPYETWVASGQAFTRVPQRLVGHYELYRWEATDASGRRVVPVDLGQICMDDFNQTYGTCLR